MSIRGLALVLAALAVTSAVTPAKGAGPYPEAAAWSPTGTNVALDGPIAITWSIRMNPASVEAAFSLSDGFRVWNASAFQWVHTSVPPWTTTAVPLGPLPASTYLLASVAPTATDASGAYPLDQDGNGTGGEVTDGFAWSFRTENGTPPRVVVTSPDNGQANVSVSADIAIEFDEPMDPVSVAAAFSLTPAAKGTFAWEDNATRATFVPDLYFVYGTTYTARLGGSVAKDANGHKLDGDGDGTGGGDYAFSFTTEPDMEPPLVMTVSPALGASGVSVSTQLVIRFSEAMNTASVASAFSFTDGSTTWDASAGYFLWRGTVFPDDTADFNPFDNFPFLARITITLNGSLARDPAGFTLDGDGDRLAEGSPIDDFTWSFTAEAADALRPTVFLVDPQDGTTGVAETTDIYLRFTEPMDRTSVEDAFSLRDTVRTWTKADGGFSWISEAMWYTPVTTLPFDRLYTITLTTAAKDVNENALDGDGAGGDFTSSFRTRAEPDLTPPTVLSTIPGDGEANVLPEALLSITFDDAMDRTSTEAALGLERGTSLEPVPVAIGDLVWDAGDYTVSFRPLSETLRWGTRYFVTVSQGAMDDAGNRLAGYYAITFTTVVWSGRVVGTVVAEGRPVSGATVRLGDQATQTASNGTFVFPSVVAGTYPLAVSKLGYATLRRDVVLNDVIAGPDAMVELGQLSLVPTAGTPMSLVLGVLLGSLAAAFAIGLLLRRWRGRPMEHFEDMDEEMAEADR